MRPSLAILTTIAIVLSSSEASACRLTDWLFGRTSTPYVVGYAPVATGPQVVGVAPVSAARPVILPTTPSTITTSPVMSSGVYQSQRPAYIDNPSVYTGMPVLGNVQAAYRVAPQTTYAPATAYRPPTTYAVPASPLPANPLAYRGQLPVTSYRPQIGTAVPGGPVTITTPTGTPATALPPTQVTPLFPPTPPQPPRGLRRFFSRLFGTGYNTTYYSAPITYYRPVTTVDPVTGAAVTVQQPCTSTVQQLQRTPLATVQSLQPSYAPAPAACPTPTYSQPIPNSYGSGIGQVGATGTMGQGAAPIPSTLPPSSYGMPGGSTGLGGSGIGTYGTGGNYNAAPLQGAPPAAASGDLTPMDRPELNRSAPPATNGNGGNGGNGSSNPSGSSEPAPSNYWQLPNAEDSTAMIRRPSNELPSDPKSLRGNVEPIQAPSGYVSPFRSRSESFRSRSEPSTQPPAATSDTFQAPPLPQRSPIDPADLTAVSTRVPVASRPNTAPRPTQRIQRDSTWYPVGK